MAPKRQQKRTPRRINVRFMKKGEDEYAVGYTKNVSAGGLFIGTIRPLPPGTEIVVAIKEGEELRQRPAVVVHAARVSPLLASVQTSGMGVRFLDGEQTEKAVTQVQDKAGESPVESVEEVAQLSEEDDGEPDIEVDLTVVESFREAFRRDIQHGLIFVPGPIAASPGQEIRVGVLVPGTDREISLKARIDRETICRSEAYGELGKTGFMLVFLESDKAVSRLRTFL
jgi:Tfp pilus assembly protein PilZ